MVLLVGHSAFDVQRWGTMMVRNATRMPGRTEAWRTLATFGAKRKLKVQSRTMSLATNKNKKTAHVELKDGNTNQSAHMPRAIKHCPWLSYQASWITGQKNLLLKLKPAVCRAATRKTASTTNKSKYQACSTKITTITITKAVAHVHGMFSIRNRKHTPFATPFMAYVGRFQGL